MPNNWGMQDPDWQLRRLQQDCVRTSDKALSVLFDTIQQEVVLVHHEYEKIFGPNSAQFAEYITLILQKLNSQGICSKTCGEWLVAAASSGVIPPVHASASFNTQSQTLKQIPGEFRSQLENTLEYSKLPDDAEFETSLDSGDGHTWPAQNEAAHETFLPQPQGADLMQEAQNYNNPWGEVEAAPAPTPRATRTGLNSLMPASMEGVNPFRNPDAPNGDSTQSGQFALPVQQSQVAPQPQVLPVQPAQPVAPATPAAPVAPFGQSMSATLPIQPASSFTAPSSPWDAFETPSQSPAQQATQPAIPGAYGQDISQQNPAVSGGFGNPFSQQVAQPAAQIGSAWPAPQSQGSVPAPAPAVAPQASAQSTEAQLSQSSWPVPGQQISGGQPVYQPESAPQPAQFQNSFGAPVSQSTSQPQPVFPPQQAPAPAPPQPAYQPQWGHPAAPAQSPPGFQPQTSQPVVPPQQSAYAQHVMPPQQSAYAQQISQTNPVPQSAFQPQPQSEYPSAYQQQVNQQQNQQQFGQQYANVPNNGASASSQAPAPYQSAPQSEPVYANIPSASMSGGWWDNPSEESTQHDNQHQEPGVDEKDPNYTYDPATAWD